MVPPLILLGQKAQRYDETLEKARKELQACGSTNCEAARQIFRLFPELKEGEDEKIRRAISDILLIDSDEIREILDTNGLFMQDIDAWLEKQGEHQKFRDSIQAGDKVTRNKDGVLVNLSQLNRVAKKQNEQNHVNKIGPDILIEESYQQQADDLIDMVTEKLADKVEPKFKVGDWIIANDDTSIHIDYACCKITKAENGNYTIESIYGYKGYNTFETFEKDYHLWTIQDAKDGDVLFQDLMGGKTLIYNGVNPDMAILYSFIISNDGEDVLPYHIGKPNTGIGNIEENKNIIHPATKEQRDTLMKAMTDAGYTFDFEKKELRKIEQKLVDESSTFKDKLLELFQRFRWYCKDEIPTNGDIIECVDAHIQELIDTVQNKPWSEEDSPYYDDICEILINLLYNETACVNKDAVQKDLDWLKSLQSQKQWKPSEEQIKAFEHFVRSVGESGYASPYDNDTKLIYSLLEQLKQL